MYSSPVYEERPRTAPEGAYAVYVVLTVAFFSPSAGTSSPSTTRRAGEPSFQLVTWTYAEAPPERSVGHAPGVSVSTVRRTRPVCASYRRTR